MDLHFRNNAEGRGRSRVAVHPLEAVVEYVRKHQCNPGMSVSVTSGLELTILPYFTAHKQYKDASSYISVHALFSSHLKKKSFIADFCRRCPSSMLRRRGSLLSIMSLTLFLSFDKWITCPSCPYKPPLSPLIGSMKVSQ